MEQEELNFRIRKLTPRECFRLMDVSEENIDKIQAAGISNSQQYKMAGNSIVVSVLVEVFRQIFRPRFQALKPDVTKSAKTETGATEEKPKYRELSIFDFLDEEDNV